MIDFDKFSNSKGTSDLAPQTVFARERDSIILQRLDVHPCSNQELSDLFTSYQSLCRRMAKLRKKNKVKLVGYVQLRDTGRPLDVYCNGWRPKYDNLKHELLLTRFLLQFPDAEIVRGYDVDQKVRPDAEMRFPGLDLEYFVEMDCGTIRGAKVRRRWTKYAEFGGIVAVIAPTKTRMQYLIKQSSDIEEKSIFTTLKDVLANPEGPVWVDASGECVSMR